MLVHRLARAERSRVTTEEFGTRGGGVVSAEVPCTNPENGTLGRDLHYGYRVFSSLLGLGVGFGGVRGVDEHLGFLCSSEAAVAAAQQ